MKKFVLVALVAGVLSVPSFSESLKDQIEALAKQYGCAGCHSVDKVIAGPPYRVVAKEYKGKPNAKETLVNSVLHGSMMKWQSLGKKYGIKVKMAYMPAQHGVTKEQVEKIVDLILKLDTNK